MGISTIHVTCSHRICYALINCTRRKRVHSQKVSGLGRFFSESLLHVPEESVEYLLCLCGTICCSIYQRNCLEKQSCNAYLSQSTRGMRSLLRKQGVCFSMPLCKAKVEQATEDNLIEFSKIRTLNLGQTLHIDVYLR